MRGRDQRVPRVDKGKSQTPNVWNRDTAASTYLLRWKNWRSESDLRRSLRSAKPCWLLLLSVTDELSGAKAPGSQRLDLFRRLSQVQIHKQILPSRFLSQTLSLCFWSPRVVCKGRSLQLILHCTIRLRGCSWHGIPIADWLEVGPNEPIDAPPPSSSHCSPQACQFSRAGNCFRPFACCAGKCGSYNPQVLLFVPYLWRRPAQ